MTTPSVASVGAVATGTAGTVPVPSGVVAGSKVVAFIAAYADAAFTATSITPPTGWTLGGFFNWDASNEGVNQADYWFWKDATGADTGSYSFSVPDVATGYALRLADSTPVGVSPFVDTIHGAGADAATVTVPAFTPGGDGNLLLMGAFGDATSIATPSGWTQVAQGAAGDDFNRVAVFSMTQATAAAVNVTLSTGADFCSALVATLRGAPAPITGTVVGTLPKVTGAVTGTVNDTSVGGSIAGTLPKITGAVAGTVTNPTPGWSAAINRAKTGDGYARILFVGDSLTEGVGADTRPHRIVEKLTSLIRTRYSIGGGQYYQPAGGFTDFDDTWYDDNTSGTGSTGLPDNGDDTQTASGGLNPDYTLGDHGSHLASGQYRDLTFTGDGFEVIYRNAGSATGAGDVQVYLDSTLIDTLDANSGTARSLRRAHYTCTNGSHTVRLQATGGTADVDGITVYVGDDPTTDGAGVVFYDCSHSGWTTTSFTPTSPVGVAFADLSPDLVIHNLWTNDMFHGMSMSAAQTRIDAALTYYESLPSAPDIVVWISNDMWDGSSTTNPWCDAVAATVADHPSVVLVDMRDNAAQMPSGDIDSNAHPNTSGQAYEAGIIDTALSALVTTPVTGTVAGTLPKTQAAATGTVDVPHTTGTLDATLAPVSGHVTGTIGTSGATGHIAATLPKVTGHAAGTIDNPEPTGEPRDITITAGPITGGWAASAPATGWLTNPPTGDNWDAQPPTGGWTATQPTG